MSENRTKSNPFGPVIGFFVLLLVAGVSIGLSGPILTFITTETVVLGSFGQVFPIAFPGDWPQLVQQGVIAVALLAVTSTLFALVSILLLGGSRRESGPMDVDIGKLREDKEAQKKAARERTRRAARNRRRR